MKIRIELLPRAGLVRSDVLAKVFNVDKPSSIKYLSEFNVIPKHTKIGATAVWKVEEIVEAIKKIEQDGIYYYHIGVNRKFVEDCKLIILELVTKKKQFTTLQVWKVLEKKYKIKVNSIHARSDKIIEALNVLEQENFLYKVKQVPRKNKKTGKFAGRQYNKYQLK